MLATKVEDDIESIMDEISRSQLFDNGDVSGAAKLITNALCRGLGVSRAGIWLIDQGRSEVSCHYLIDEGHDKTDQSLRLTRQDFPDYFNALDEELTISADDASTHPATHEFSSEYLPSLSIVSMLDTPIRHKGEMVGVLCAEQKHSRRTWSAMERLFTLSLSESYGRALNAAHRLDAERQLLNLSDSQSERLHNTLSHITQGITMFDSDSNLAWCNSRWSELMNIPTSLTVPGTPFVEILRLMAARGDFDEDYPGKTVEEMVDIRLNTVWQLNGKRKLVKQLADGRYIEYIATPLDEGGTVTTYSDVTEREEAELAQHTARTQLDLTLEHIHQGINVVDADLNIVWNNRQYAEMLGLDPTNFNPKTWFDVVELSYNNGDFKNRYPGLPLEKVIEKELATIGHHKKFEFIHQRADGRLILITSNPAPDGKNIATFTDVTDKENTHLALDAILQNITQGVSLYDHNYALVFCNEQFRTMLRLPESLTQSGTSFRQVIEHCAARGDYGEVFEGEHLQRVVDYRLEQLKKPEKQKQSRIQTDGRVIESIGVPLSSGGIVMTYQDVTDQKNIENKLRASETSLREILNCGPSACGVRTVKDGRGLLFSKVGEELFGLSLEQWEQIGPRDYTLDGEIVEAMITEVLKTGHAPAREIRYLSADNNQPWWGLMSITRIKFEGEECLLFWATKIDDVKQSELKLTKARDELNERTQELRDLLETSPIGIAIRSEANSQTLLLNETGQKMTEMTPQEWATHPNGRRFVDPECGLEMVNELRQTGHAKLREVEFFNKSGRKYWTLTSLHRVKFAGERSIVFWSADIMRLKAAERDLAAAKDALDYRAKEMRMLLEASPIGIGIRREHDGKTIFLNKTSQTMRGLSDGIFFDRPLDDGIVDPAVRQSIASELNSTGQVKQREVQFRNEKGEVYWTLASLHRMAFEEMDATVFWTVDIEKQKHTEHALAEARDMAEAATRSKSEFLANMSHEIRTPLNAITGFSHLAMQTTLDNQQRDYLTKIERSSDTLLGVINDILDFSKIEAGRLDIEHIPFKLDEVLDHLSDLIRVKADEKGLEVFISHPPSLPLRLIGDPLRLGQILINLASNAVKFTENGEITIEVKPIHSDARHCVLEFSVADTGVGISKTQMTKLFRPFTQADTSTTRRFGGTGLGLTISKNLVDLMSGSIEVQSTEGKGSRFTFSLPFDLDIDAETSDNDTRVQHQLQGRKVLVVDDNRTSRDILSSMLEGYGLVVDTASDGQQALDCVEAAQTDKSDGYELVIMDWRMPIMDGVEASRKIRNLPGQQSLPSIIMVTAHTRKELFKQAGQEEFDAVLVKPVSPLSMLNQLKTALGSKSIPNSHQKETQDKPESHSLTGIQVLLVEDNPVNQQIAQELLTAKGIDVTTVNNGLDATQAVKKQAFQLVLMDVQMPIMDGIEATRVIRESRTPDELPILAMTAHALQEERLRCLEAGMNDHLTKPINPDILINKIAHFVLGGEDVHSVAQQMVIPEDLDKLQSHGIEVEKGLSRVAGNVQLYRKLLVEFFADYSDAPQQLRGHCSNRETSELARLAHTIKGAAANLGLTKLSETIAAIEQNASEEPELTDPLHRQFEQNYAQLTRAASQLFVATCETSGLPLEKQFPQKGESDKTQLLVALEQCLTAGSIEAANIIQQLTPLLTGEAAAIANEVMHDIDDFEYEAALSKVADLKRVILE